MTRLCLSDELLDAQAVRAILGSQIGPIVAVSKRIDEADLDSWYEEWTKAATLSRQRAEDSLNDGNIESAKVAYLQACTFFRTAGSMLLGTPLDPRLVRSYADQRDAFQAAAKLMPSPPELVEIPYESTTLPGYFFSAGPEARATLILTNGYDGTMEEVYFYSGAEAVRRGYNVLLFDGPGQGNVLLEQRLTLRPDWENVIAPAVDFLLKRTDVDAKRIGLIGLSLGGYLAPRAASFEHRLAACVADCGSNDLQAGAFKLMPGDLSQRLLANDPEAVATVRGMLEGMMKHPTKGWSLRRMQLVHGIDDPVELLLELGKYSVERCGSQISCPTCVTYAEGDPISASAPDLYEHLTCPKQLFFFTAEEGAGDHCETAARELYFSRTFGWLDRVLEPKRSQDGG